MGIAAPINKIAGNADTIKKIADIADPINKIAGNTDTIKKIVDIADPIDKIADNTGPINPIAEVIDEVKETIDPEPENLFTKIIGRSKKSYESFKRIFEAEDRAEFWLKLSTAFYDIFKIIQFKDFFD